MHRRPLLDLLDRYQRDHSDERACIERIRRLVSEHEDCFERSCLPGHITASAWILSPDNRSCLLTHHRKLTRWLQLGGHADGDSDVLAVALREAREESGMMQFDVLSRDVEGRAVPLDVDVHVIPARKSEPAHEHHDIRFLLRAAPQQMLQMSEESIDLRWFPLDARQIVSNEESIVRMAAKVPGFLAAAPPADEVEASAQGETVTQ